MLLLHAVNHLRTIYEHHLAFIKISAKYLVSFAVRSRYEGGVGIRLLKVTCTWAYVSKGEFRGAKFSLMNRIGAVEIRNERKQLCSHGKGSRWHEHRSDNEIPRRTKINRVEVFTRSSSSSKYPTRFLIISSELEFDPSYRQSSSYRCLWDLEVR